VNIDFNLNIKKKYIYIYIYKRKDLYINQTDNYYREYIYIYIYIYISIYCIKNYLSRLLEIKMGMSRDIFVPSGPPLALFSLVQPRGCCVFGSMKS